MMTIVVLLSIRSEEAFQRFEHQAIAIMAEYGGKLDSAFRPSLSDPLPSAGVDEVHILKFPDQEAFERYKADARLVPLTALREEAIISTTVYASMRELDY